jgi:uncharacterized protein
LQVPVLKLLGTRPFRWSKESDNLPFAVHIAYGTSIGPEHLMQAVLNRSTAVHGVLIFAMLAVIIAGFPPLPWPLHLLLPLLAYAGIMAAVPGLRSTAPELSVGRLIGAPLACAAALAVATAAVLIVVQTWSSADMSALTARLPTAARNNLVLAGIIFCLANATLEELVFRGILWDMVAKEQSNIVALAVTAVLFGLGHLHGYPPGIGGAILAGLYGLGQGVLRWWTGGLGLAIACHVCADAAIFGLLIWSQRGEQELINA